MIKIDPVSVILVSLTSLFQGLMFMLAIWFIHEVWWDVVPKMGYGTAVAVSILLRASLIDLYKYTKKQSWILLGHTIIDCMPYEVFRIEGARKMARICQKCDSRTHRDDAMGSRCNRCEYLERYCICPPMTLIEDGMSFDFRNGDIIIDMDKSPWQYFDGRFGSMWSASHKDVMACDEYAKDTGWVTRSFLFNGNRYGPYYLIYRRDRLWILLGYAIN